VHEPPPVISQRLWMADDCKGSAVPSLLMFAARQMLSSSRVKPFGGPRLLLETIRKRGEAAIAGAATRSDRQPCLPASSTIPLQIDRGRIYEPHAVGKQDAPDRARRHTQTELQQLAGDPRVAPAWVLSRETQHELSHPTIDRRTAHGPLRLRPPATNELPMPAQKRLWCHEQAASGLRQDSRQRGKEGAIGGAQRRRRCCRPSTTSWCRKTSNSTSFANSLLRPLTSSRSTAEMAR
jgi:hypothetical protein